MRSTFQAIAISVLIFISSNAIGQDLLYTYHVNLNEVENDKLKIELIAPKINQNSIHFFMPKIIPGTYRESNFGRFVSELKAFDAKGRSLPVQRLDDNSWKIDKAKKISKLTYWVEDIFDSEIENEIFRMSATNIEAGQNFVISSPGFFGYFEEMKQVPFKVQIFKPEGFYGSTGLIPIETNSKKDIFLTKDYDELVDSPFMYNIPDTTIINIGGTQVLVSVYSPRELIKSDFIASNFERILRAEAAYLGGTLPVKKYAFIMYFADPSTASPLGGALEHNVSSFYYLIEHPQEAIISHVMDIAAHEFFHIITPLTLHSEEIENFDFNQPVLSKHLWLYEGVTEYASDHVQVKYNLNSQNDYLRKIEEKINISTTHFNDNLPFTELSTEAASKHSSQYANVYEKGALIAAMLDIRLLELSNGEMSLMDLLNKLGEKYNMNKPFKDSELFSILEELSYPEIGSFFKEYVAGTKSLPFKEYFAKVGIKYGKEPSTLVATFGQVQFGYNPDEQKLMIGDASNMNEFGKNVGWKTGDLIYQIQGQAVNLQNYQTIFKNYAENTKSGEKVDFVVGRVNDNGVYEEINLSSHAVLVEKVGRFTLEIDENAKFEQLKMRNLWLTNNEFTATPEDVNDINSIVTSLYDVISGPAGERNWDRFFSLFAPSARMSMIYKDNSGKAAYRSITPEEYKQENKPHFERSSFFEKEIGRQEMTFGELVTVLSAYESSSEKDSKVIQRGVNSIQLVRTQGRWWISNIIWNAESEENKIPEKYLYNK